MIKTQKEWLYTLEVTTYVIQYYILLNANYSYFKYWRIKKTLLTKIYLAIDCQWGEWNTGICSADCGDGTRTNTREKIVEEDYGGACNGTDSQSVPCKEKECTGKPIMMAWSTLCTDVFIYNYII